MVLDEIALIFHLFEGNSSSRVMVDVGAHWGSSLMRFACSGWSVYAFEHYVDELVSSSDLIAFVEQVPWYNPDND